MQSHLSHKGTSKLSNINKNSTSQDKIKIRMAVAVVEAEGKEGAGVVGEAMAEAMVGMITTKGAMVDMDTKADMDIKVDMGTREGMATTKVATEGMATTKVDMEDTKMVAGTTTGTEVVVAAAAAEEEATGDTVVQGMSVVAEVEAAQAAGAMRGAVDGWVAAVGGATKTIRSSWVWICQPPHRVLYDEKKR